MCEKNREQDEWQVAPITVPFGNEHDIQRKLSSTWRGRIAEKEINAFHGRTEIKAINYGQQPFSSGDDSEQRL